MCRKVPLWLAIFGPLLFLIAYIRQGRRRSDVFSLNRFIFDVMIGVAVGLFVFFVTGDTFIAGLWAFFGALLADVVARLQ